MTKMKVYHYFSPLHTLGLIQINLWKLLVKTTENLLDKNKIEIYSARYTPLNAKEPTQLSTLQLHLLGQQIGKRKN